MSMEDIFSDAGRDILEHVTRAIETNNYTHLGDDIRGTVNQAAGTIRTTVQDHSVYQSSYYNPNQPRTKTPPMPQRGVTPPVRNHTYQTTFSGGRTPFMPRFISSAGSIAKSIVGGIGSFGLGIATLSMGVAAVTFGLYPGLLIGLSVVGVLFLSSLGLFSSGIRDNKLLKRYRNYNAIVGNKEYITIEQLCTISGQSKNRVLSDIQKLHSRNYIPYAAFDKDKSTLMLTDSVYKEYVRSEAARVAAAKEDALAAKEADRDPLPTDVRELVSEGNAYLRKVRDYNDLIPDTEEMSNKLYELENIMKRIFDKVKSEPKSAKELRRFMTYYLPTTEKLLAAYVDIQNQGGEGENVTNTRHEIENAMDVINNAFATLLDQLFQRTAWDVSSDISVMKTMMAQDGLTENAMAEMHN